MNHCSANQRIGGPWDLIIKISGARRKKAKRSAYAFEATNLQGMTMFTGCTSSAAATGFDAAQEALVEAAIRARSLGFNNILVLSSSRRIVQVYNM